MRSIQEILTDKVYLVVGEEFFEEGYDLSDPQDVVAYEMAKKAFPLEVEFSRLCHVVKCLSREAELEEGYDEVTYSLWAEELEDILQDCYDDDDYATQLEAAIRELREKVIPKLQRSIAKYVYRKRRAFNQMSLRLHLGGAVRRTCSRSAYGGWYNRGHWVSQATYNPGFDSYTGTLSVVVLPTYSSRAPRYSHTVATHAAASRGGGDDGGGGGDDGPGQSDPARPGIPHVKKFNRIFTGPLWPLHNGGLVMSKRGPPGRVSCAHKR